MAKINLLPWREELRAQKKQDFINAIGVAVLVTAIIFVGVHMYIDGLKAYQEQRNKIIQDEIALLDIKIAKIKTIEEQKSKLLIKIDLIQKLQESRPEIVHLFDELPNVTPDGVFLTKFAQVGTELNFQGKSQSNARVSAFMRAIEASDWLKVPTLDVIQTASKVSPEQLSDFTLHAKQGNQNVQAAAGGK
ncbi:MAG: PilN domain-containing protein [Methylobacter sp.]|uniref:PilN domain-containing protein n=1 Tax=Methylobacter sp. TaxID=2051955 RepID=UPI0027156B71|nr:PilN domain-containing protein [Methylobacter sp.]MDO9270806.1 PilN domain-containing protein [Methylobacter sp.]MDP1664591.1 PilN domain-containing protein [Methylobacter sp.]MDP1970563.1 PilN domain-containing protein [Methylobacter sp.]